MKKLIVLLFILCTTHCFAIEIFRGGNLWYTLYSTEEVKLKRWDFERPAAKYIIPENPTIEMFYKHTFSVIGIHSEAFKDNQMVQTVIIPSTIEELGSCIFENCSNLKEVEFQNQMKRIPGGTFEDCVNLEKIKLRYSIEEIGYKCFKNCTKLKEISIPHIVDGYAFAGCTSLDTIDIKYCLYIGENAFSESGISSLNLTRAPMSHDKIRFIGDRAFSNCINLKSVILNDIDSVKIGMFENCKNLQIVHFPKEIRLIQEDAFKGCESLKSIWFHGKTKVSYTAFADCNSLDSVVIYAESFPELDFKAPNDHCTLYVPISLIDKYQHYKNKGFVAVEPIDGTWYSYYIYEYKWVFIGGIVIVIVLLFFIFFFNKIRKNVFHKRAENNKSNSTITYKSLCPECRSPISDNLKFCPSCGVKLRTDVADKFSNESITKTNVTDDNTSSVSSVNNPQKENEVAKSAKSKWIILGIVLVIISSVLGYFVVNHNQVSGDNELQDSTTAISYSDSTEYVPEEEEINLPSYSELKEFYKRENMNFIYKYHAEKLYEDKELVDTLEDYPVLDSYWGIDTKIEKQHRNGENVHSFIAKSNHAIILNRYMNDYEDTHHLYIYFINQQDYERFKQECEASGDNMDYIELDRQITGTMHSCGISFFFNEIWYGAIFNNPSLTE